MIDFYGYNKIKEYCNKNKHNKVYELFLYYKYVEEMNNLIQTYKIKNSGDPNNDIITGFNDSCLSEDRLKNDIILVEEEIKEISLRK